MLKWWIGPPVAVIVNDPVPEVRVTVPVDIVSVPSPPPFPGGADDDAAAGDGEAGDDEAGVDAPPVVLDAPGAAVVAIALADPGEPVIVAPVPGEMLAMPETAGASPIPPLERPELTDEEKLPASAVPG